METGGGFGTMNVQANDVLTLGTDNNSSVMYTLEYVTGGGTSISSNSSFVFGVIDFDNGSPDPTVQVFIESSGGTDATSAQAFTGLGQVDVNLPAVGERDSTLQFRLG